MLSDYKKQKTGRVEWKAHPERWYDYDTKRDHNTLQQFVAVQLALLYFLICLPVLTQVIDRPVPMFSEQTEEEGNWAYAIADWMFISVSPYVVQGFANLSCVRNINLAR